MKMTKEFLEAWTATHLEEKGYVKNPLDSGGETNHGITIAVARADGYMGEMRDLPLDRAREIAKRRYWDTLRLDEVSVLSPAVSRELFDTGFLCGQGNSGRFLQVSLNAFNRSHRAVSDYPEVLEDGLIGPGTLYSFRMYMSKRGKAGERAMLNCLNSQQGAYLLGLVRPGPADKDEEFIFGWFLNRVTY